jgi:hypothetical protein
MLNMVLCKCGHEVIAVVILLMHIQHVKSKVTVAYRLVADIETYNLCLFCGVLKILRKELALFVEIIVGTLAGQISQISQNSQNKKGSSHGDILDQRGYRRSCPSTV